MPYYFAWLSSASEPFDPVAHARSDELVTEFEIEHTATEDFARLTATIKNPGLGFLNGSGKRYCVVSYRPHGSADDPVPLFKGRISAFPEDFVGGLIQLEFLAEPEDWEAKLKALTDTMKVAPWYDPLFVGDDAEDAVEVLDGRCVSFYWDPVTHEVSATDFLVGEETINLGSSYVRDSLRPSLVAPPLSRIDVKMSVEWEQTAEGLCDIGPRLRAALSDSFYTIKTYTPADFEGLLPKRGSSIGSASGWTVHSADISRTGYRQSVVDRYSYTSYGGMTPATHVYTCGLVGATYRIGPVMLRYEYRQKRVEKAAFSVSQAHQPLVSEAGRVETLELSLEDITADKTTPLWQPYTFYAAGTTVRYGSRNFKCLRAHTSSSSFATYGWFEDEVDPDDETGIGFDNGWVEVWRKQSSDASALGRSDRARFLDTDRGRQAIEHAILVAKAKLRASLRAIELSFTGRWTELSGITLRHSVTIYGGSKLPGGTATGKVVRYALKASGDAPPTVDVTIGVAVGTSGSNPISDGYVSDYVEDGYAEPEWQADGVEYEGVDGIVYSLSAPAPVERIRVGDLSRHSYAVVRCDGANRAPRQEQAARQAFSQEFDMGASMDSDWRTRVEEAVNDRVSETPTRLVLRMRSLAAEDELSREVSVSVKPLATPKGIDLSAS